MIKNRFILEYVETKYKRKTFSSERAMKEFVSAIPVGYEIRKAYEVDRFGMYRIPDLMQLYRSGLYQDLSDRMTERYGLDT